VSNAPTLPWFTFGAHVHTESHPDPHPHPIPPTPILLSCSLVAGVSALTAANSARADDATGVASSRMSYSRFLEYLEMGRVKKVGVGVGVAGHVGGGGGPSHRNGIGMCPSCSYFQTAHGMPRPLPCTHAHARARTHSLSSLPFSPPRAQVDLYENGTIAIVEAVSPELGNRIQRVRVQLPGTSTELLQRFRDKKVDFAAHAQTEDGGAIFLNLLGNLAFPLLLVGGLFLLSRRQGGGMPGGPGNPMAFGKSKAKFQMEPNTGIGFDDVAGVDEAKQDFEEVSNNARNIELQTGGRVLFPWGGGD
jgi:hypothetical protein